MDIKIRTKELEDVLKAISQVRPQWAAKIGETGSITSAECKELFHELLKLYALIGSNAESYLNLIQALTQRTGNVEAIREGVDRRRDSKDDKEAA